MHSNVAQRTDKKEALLQAPMSRLPNQSERADLLVKIARSRRLIKEVHDQETIKRLLALEQILIRHDHNLLRRRSSGTLGR